LVKNKQIRAGYHLTISLECLKTLAFEEWNARETRIEDVAICGEWMVSHEEYTQWSESSNPSALWLEGKPGSGKSTLAKLIVHKLENRENDSGSVTDASSVPTKGPQPGRHIWTLNNPEDKSTIIVRFYYSFRGGNTETSHELMLRSIVYQIWNNNSRLYKLLKDRYRGLQNSNSESERTSFWRYADLKSLLRSLHEIDFSLKVVIVVDGMDESDNVMRDDVLRFLPDLVVRNSNCIVKILNC
jgi:DNA polymerase III delta prime subunit